MNRSFNWLRIDRPIIWVCLAFTFVRGNLGQVNRAFELATGRPADNLRQQVMKKAYDKQKAVFDQNPAQADQLLAMGDSPREKSIDAKEHATWTVLASMILNLDETLNRE